MSSVASNLPFCDLNLKIASFSFINKSIGHFLKIQRFCLQTSLDISMHNISIFSPKYLIKRVWCDSILCNSDSTEKSEQTREYLGGQSCQSCLLHQPTTTTTTTTTTTHQIYIKTCPILQVETGWGRQNIKKRSNIITLGFIWEQLCPITELLYHEITSAFITALIMTLFSLASYKISSQILALELSSGEVTFSYFKLKA